MRTAGCPVPPPTRWNWRREKRTAPVQKQQPCAQHRIWWGEPNHVKLNGKSDKGCVVEFDESNVLTGATLVNIFWGERTSDDSSLRRRVLCFQPKKFPRFRCFSLQLRPFIQEASFRRVQLELPNLVLGALKTFLSPRGHFQTFPTPDPLGHRPPPPPIPPQILDPPGTDQNLCTHLSDMLSGMFR